MRTFYIKNNQYNVNEAWKTNVLVENAHFYNDEKLPINPQNIDMILKQHDLYVFIDEEYLTPLQDIIHDSTHPILKEIVDMIHKINKKSKSFKIDERIFNELENMSIWLNQSEETLDKLDINVYEILMGLFNSHLQQNEPDAYDLTQEDINTESDRYYDVFYDYESALINVWKIPSNSLLEAALIQWYGNFEEMVKNIRDCWEDPYTHDLYFTTGCGYDFISDDLLNGDATGQAKSEFLHFLNTGESTVSNN